MAYHVRFTFTNGNRLNLNSSEDLFEGLAEGLKEDDARVIIVQREGRRVLIPRNNIQFIEIEEQDVR